MGKIVRVSNSQDIGSVATQGLTLSSDFKVSFEEDIIINENSRIGLLSAQLPLQIDPVSVDDDNNEFEILVQGSISKTVTLDNGIYTDPSKFADMVAKVINATFDYDDTSYNELGCFVQIKMVTTSGTNQNISLDFWKSPASIMSTTDLLKNITVDVDGNMSAPLNTPSTVNNYCFQNLPIQPTSAYVRCTVASKANNSGANPVFTSRGPMFLGITNVKMTGTEVGPPFVKYFGLQEIAANRYGFFKFDGNGPVRINVGGAYDNTAQPGDVLSMEFSDEQLNYIVYRPTTTVINGMSTVYDPIFLDEDGWIPDTNNQKYYAAVSLANTNTTAPASFFISTPRVINSPNLTLSNGKIVDSDSINVYHDYNFVNPPPISHDGSLGSMTEDENGIPVVYSNSGIEVLPPEPVQGQNITITFNNEAVWNLFGVPPASGALVSTIIMNSPHGTFLAPFPFGNDITPKSILVELMNISTIKSYDSTTRGRRNIVAVIPRTKIESNLLIYNNNTPVMVDLDNHTKISLRNLHIRLLLYDSSLVPLKDSADLVFIID